MVTALIPLRPLEPEGATSLGQTVSLWHALVIACVPAIVGVVGVVVTVIVNARHEKERRAHDDAVHREQRHHERALDRERFVRQERLREYARIITLSRVALRELDEAVRTTTRLGADHQLAAIAATAAMETLTMWRTAWAEVEIVASDDLNHGLKELDAFFTALQGRLAVLTVADGRQEGRRNVPTDRPSLTDGIKAIERLVSTARRELGALPAADDLDKVNGHQPR